MAEEEKQAMPDKKYGVLTLKELKDLKLFSVEIGSDAIYEECYSNASFDLTLGNEYFFPKQYQDALQFEVQSKGRNNVNDLTPDEKFAVLANQIQLCTNNNRLLKIPRFSSVVISTNELVTLPNNVAGRFDLRVRWAMAGLILQVGTQIEPGYSGRLWGLLHNFSGQEVTILYNNKFDRLLTAEFYFTCDLSEPTPGKLNKPKTLLELLKKYPVKEGSLQNYFDHFDRLYNTIEAKVKSELESLEKKRVENEKYIQANIKTEINKIDKLTKDVTDTQTNARRLLDTINENRSTRISIVLLIVTVLISIILPIVINKYSFDKADYQIFDQSKGLKDKLDTLNAKFEYLKSDHEKLRDSINKSRQMPDKTPVSQPRKPK